MRGLSGLKGTQLNTLCSGFVSITLLGGLLILFSTGTYAGIGIKYNLLTTLKVLPALLGGYVFLNTKGSRILRILLCLKHDLLPELGTGLLSR